MNKILHKLDLLTGQPRENPAEAACYVGANGVRIKRLGALHWQVLTPAGFSPLAGDRAGAEKSREKAVSPLRDEQQHTHVYKSVQKSHRRYQSIIKQRYNRSLPFRGNITDIVNSSVQTKASAHVNMESLKISHRKLTVTNRCEINPYNQDYLNHLVRGNQAQLRLIQQQERQERLDRLTRQELDELELVARLNSPQQLTTERGTGPLVGGTIPESSKDRTENTHSSLAELSPQPSKKKFMTIQETFESTFCRSRRKLVPHHPPKDRDRYRPKEGSTRRYQDQFALDYCKKVQLLEKENVTRAKSKEHAKKTQTIAAIRATGVAVTQRKKKQPSLTRNPLSKIEWDFNDLQPWRQNADDQLSQDLSNIPINNKSMQFRDGSLDHFSQTSCV